MSSDRYKPNEKGFSLTELVIVTGLMAGLGLIISSLMAGINGLNNRLTTSSYGLENLVQTQLALTRLLGQAVNIRGADDSLLNNSNPNLEFSDNVNTPSLIYHNNGSRILSATALDGAVPYISSAHTVDDWQVTLPNDPSNAAAALNTDLLALFFYENQGASSAAAPDLSSDIQPAALYFQKPTRYTSGVIYILRGASQNGGNLSLAPCSACPANVISEIYDGIVEFDILELIRPAQSASLSVLDGGQPPLTGARFRIVTRSFLKSGNNGWQWCVNNPAGNGGINMNVCNTEDANNPAISPHQDFVREFTITFRNNIQFLGTVDSPSGGNINTPFEERTLGPIYFFRTQLNYDFNNLRKQF